MSLINNTNPPGRGKLLTSADMNLVFTEINNGFPMDAENVRDEGLDQPVFKTASPANGGKSGLILVAADDDTTTSSTVVTANTSATSPYLAPSTTQTFATGGVVFSQNNIIRVYWQFNQTTSTTSVSTPITADTNATAWAVWLEWQLASGGAWVPVPFQSDFEDIQVSPQTHGASTLQTYASTLINHVYIVDLSGTPSYLEEPERSSYGCWWFKADANYVIHGLRLRARGLVQNFYNSTPVSGPAVNAWELVDSSNNYNLTVSRSNISYLIMREQ